MTIPEFSTIRQKREWLVEQLVSLNDLIPNEERYRMCINLGLSVATINRYFDGRLGFVSTGEQILQAANAFLNRNSIPA